MKLMYCAHCRDVVRLFPEKRSCKCGKSWGQYLEDNSTTVQTWPGLSIGIANPDFTAAEQAFSAAPQTFSPTLTMRCWINPASEPDVKFVQGVSIEADEPETEAETSAEAVASRDGSLAEPTEDGSADAGEQDPGEGHAGGA